VPKQRALVCNGTLDDAKRIPSPLNWSFDEFTMNAKIKSDRPVSVHIPVRELDEQLPDTVIPVTWSPWPEPGYKALPHVKTGLLLGAMAGCTSLLTNVIGSVLWPAIGGEEQHPLRIIQVYLTFPLGEYALQLNTGAQLALGCMLYLCTGMLYGMLFEFLMSYLVPRARLGARLIFCSILALCVWAINFYALLAWIQPLFLGGRWIIELIPWWVAALTHLVFGWTTALIFPLGLRESGISTADIFVE
jgi:hypothetical protein